jgi:hypothetical protein
MDATSEHDAARHATGPTGPGSVILELGADVGAIIVQTPPDLAGREIEISPSAGGPRTHSLVRERRTAAGASYAAVYPAVCAGKYTVWREDGISAGQLAVHGGQVSQFSWPDASPASPA